MIIGLIAQQAAGNPKGLVNLAITAITVVFFIRVVEGSHKASSGGSFFKGLVPVFLGIMTLGAYNAGTLFPALESTGASMFSYLAATLQQSFA